MTKAPIGYQLIQGGNVPGGHRVISDGKRKPFITPVREFNSIQLRHSDVVADIGAYCGTYAIRCARFPVKRVIAYEPTPETCAILRMTRLPNLSIINAAVVGDDRPSVNLYISKGIGVTNSVILSRRKERALTVPAIRYEKAVADATIVKIDVEGAEYTYKIIQPQLRAILIDFHPIPGRDWIGRANEIMDDLEAAGFRAVIKPDFSCGWTCSGSWIRDRETSGECEPLMSGKACCGCGRKIRGQGKSLCPECFDAWLPKHRAGFTRAGLA